MILNILFIIIGFSLLVKGADFLVNGSISIAKKLRIPTIIIGLTIVSIGTSMPEFVVTLTSSIKGHSDLAIGNVIGSNISNLFLILGVCASLKSLKFKDETVKLEIPIVIFLTSLLYILGNNGTKKEINKLEGLLLVIFCILFILYNIYMARRNSMNDAGEDKNISIGKTFFNIIIGIIGLKYGGDFVVNGASRLAISMGISEKMISLTIVAFSTSLPELITSITATIKGEIDMAIGNVMGSNIFNIVLIIGATALINPIEYSLSYNKDIIMLLIGMIVLNIIPFIGEKNKISRIGGFAYIISYLSYMISLVKISG